MATYITYEAIDNVSSEVFTPDRGIARNTKHRVLTATFGDGYEQRAVDGLNAQEETVSLNFVNRPNTEIDALVSALNTNIGTSASIVLNGPTLAQFDADAGLEATATTAGQLLKGVCDSYNRTLLYEGPNGASSLSATFRKVYEP